MECLESRAVGRTPSIPTWKDPEKFLQRGSCNGLAFNGTARPKEAPEELNSIPSIHTVGGLAHALIPSLGARAPLAPIHMHTPAQSPGNSFWKNQNLKIRTCAGCSYHEQISLRVATATHVQSLEHCPNQEEVIGLNAEDRVTNPTARY